MTPPPHRSAKAVYSCLLLSRNSIGPIRSKGLSQKDELNVRLTSIVRDEEENIQSMNLFILY